MKPDGIQRGSASYPGKGRPVLSSGLPPMTANRPDEEIPKRGGTEGGRFTGSTDESGPMKPGNSVEEKTLRIRKGEAGAGRQWCHRADPRPDFLDGVIEKGEVVDERWQ